MLTERIRGLKRLAGGGLLLLEIRGIRRELAALYQVGARIATALEAYNAHQWPQRVAGAEGQSTVEVTYADSDQQQEFMDIELRLTAALGMPPSEDQILAEYDRRHAQAALTDDVG